MLITMIPMQVMEMAVYEVIDVIAVGNCLMSTIGAMGMLCVMAPTVVGGAN
jgi:hypothetical protein